MKHLKPLYESKMHGKSMQEQADIIEDIFMELIDEDVCEVIREYEDDPEYFLTISVMLENNRFLIESLEEYEKTLKKSTWVVERLNVYFKKLRSLGVVFEYETDFEVVEQGRVGIQQHSFVYKYLNIHVGFTR